MFEGLADSVSAFVAEMPIIIRTTLEENEVDLLNRQSKQLLRGLASDGGYLQPYYSEDPYFKSRESANRYAEWKKTLTYPRHKEDRPTDVPNLYINGKFHSEIEVEFHSDDLQFVGGTATARDIMGKYGEENFGLTDESWSEVADEYLTESLKQELLNKILG